MYNNHLHSVLLKQNDIKNEFDELEKLYCIKPIYFWDEARQPHFGEGWLCEYIILGVTFGVGIIAKSFLEYPFKKIGDSAFKAVFELFKSIALKYKRKKSFFYIKNVVEGTTITVFLESDMLKNEKLLIETQEIVEKLTKLIQEQNEFVTYYYEGSFLVKYDSRCEDLMIYPSRFDMEIEGGSLFTTSYGWALVDNPDPTKNPTFQIDNLLLIRALFHRSLFEYTKALSYFKKAVQVSTKNINVYLEMGSTLFMARRYSEAINCWQKCIDITDNDRDKSRVYFNIGCGYTMLNSMNQAADMFSNALALGLDRSIIESDPTLEIFRNSKEYTKIYNLSLQ
ncbi:MAG: hypothetical protein A7315_08175 [Candidatus Altiarchaeales archaeon WOR_SM1_79]|nr:MAG: hypothetical protein A7315_08175 [Candidatus Altiarchaeales archaeon WOR_SM1_79]